MREAAMQALTVNWTIFIRATDVNQKPQKLRRCTAVTKRLSQILKLIIKVIDGALTHTSATLLMW